MNLKNSQFTNQTGVTLFLAILVLSAVMAISFSMATILFVEIRVSGDLLRTEGAFYGAEAVTEEALFKVKRNITTGLVYTTNFGDVRFDNPAPVETSTTSPITQDIVAITDYTFLNTTKHYPIFDLDCPSPNPGSPSLICQSGGSGYGKLTLTFLNSDPSYFVSVYLCEFNPVGTYLTPVCSDVNSAEYWLTPSPAGFSLNSVSSPKVWLLDPYKQQELILVNPSGSVNLYVQIEGFGLGPVFEPKGLPLIGETAVEVTAQNSSVTRKIRVKIPKTN